jgi:hypothetical protein
METEFRLIKKGDIKKGEILQSVEVRGQTLTAVVRNRHPAEGLMNDDNE